MTMEVIESAKYFSNLGRFDAEKMKAHDCQKLTRNTAFYTNAADARKRFSEMPSLTRGLPGKLGYDLTEELQGLQSNELQQTTFEPTTRTNVLGERLCCSTEGLIDRTFTTDITKSKEIVIKGRTILSEKANTTKVTENSNCFCPKENNATQNDKSTGNSRTLKKVTPPQNKGQRHESNNDRTFRSKRPASLPSKDATKDLPECPVSPTEREFSDLDGVRNSLSRIENVQTKIKAEMNDIRITLDEKVDKIEKSYKMITSDVRELGELVELARFVNNRIERCSIRERLKKHFEDRNEVAFSLEQESR